MTTLFCTVLVALLMFNTNGEEPVTGPVFPGKDPGKARAEISDSSLILANEAIEARWNLRDGRLRFDSIVNCLDSNRIKVNEDLFCIAFRDGRLVKSSDMTVTASPSIDALAPLQDARVFSRRRAGAAIRIGLKHEETGLNARWRAILRDGANAVRVELTVEAEHTELLLAEIVLMELHLPGATVAGRVKGSPVTGKGMKFAFEHPLSENSVANGLGRGG